MMRYHGKRGSELAWSRIIASGIDGTLLTGITWTIGIMLGEDAFGDDVIANWGDAIASYGVFFIASTLPTCLYFVLLEGSDGGATIGKTLLGLRVNGGRSAAVGRNLFRWGLTEALLLSTFVPRLSDDIYHVISFFLLVVWLWWASALFRGDGRTSYDRWAGSSVVSG